MADITTSADKMKDAIPPELQGFVIAAIVVVAIMAGMTLLFWLMRHRLTFDQTVETPTQQASGKAPKTRAPKTSAKEKQKTRDAAWAMGFMADDVEREAPIDITDAKKPETGRRHCARYTYPEHVESNAEWALLRRPAASATVETAQGWQLVWHKGEHEPYMLAMIKSVTEDRQWKDRFFEMELARNSLTFYWDEFGGPPQVQKLKAYLDQIKHKGGA